MGDTPGDAGDPSPDDPGATGTAGDEDLGVVPSRARRGRDRPSPLRLLSVGWVATIAWALAVAAIVALLAEAVVALAAFAGHSSAGVGEVARAGGILFLTFHHVPIVLEPPRTPSGLSSFGLIGGFQIVLAFAALLGTCAVVAGLWLGGRAVAERAPGSGWMRALHGTKVALPYAAACFGISYLLDMGVLVSAGTTQLGLSSQVVSVAPDHLAALLWPLVVGAVAGFSGGVFARTGGVEPERALPDARLRAAVAGGWTMVVLGLAFAFAGLLVLAVVHPHTANAYVHGMFAGGTFRGLALLVLNLLAVPNMASWVLFPSMGACVGGSASFTSSIGHGAVSQCLVSYTAFGFHGGGGAILQGAATGGLPTNPVPAAYFLFVAVPVAAVLLGARSAVRAGGVRSRADGAALGSLAGVVYGLLALGLALLSQIIIRIHATAAVATGRLGAGGQLRLGPYVLMGGAVALGWGVVVGAFGGWLFGTGPPSMASAGESVDEGEPALDVSAGLPEGGPDAPGL